MFHPMGIHGMRAAALSPPMSLVGQEHTWLKSQGLEVTAACMRLWLRALVGGVALIGTFIFLAVA